MRGLILLLLLKNHLTLPLSSAIIHPQERKNMSAFLMDKKNTSSLAYAIFKGGEYNSHLQEAFEKDDIRGPEDLFIALRKANLKSLEARYGDKWTEDDVGEYDFDHDELNLPDIFKGISCWQYQSCESKEVEESDLYRALGEFKADCAMKYIRKSEDYEKSEMWK